MPTEVIKRIGSNPSDDYSSLHAWYAARKGNLVTRDTIEIAELRGQYHHYSSAFVMNESTTDANHYFVIRAMPGAEWKGNDSDPSIARIELQSSGSSYGFYISDEYTKLQHFKFYANINSSGTYLDIYGIYLGYGGEIDCLRADAYINNSANPPSYVIGYVINGNITVRNSVISGTMINYPPVYTLFTHCTNAGNYYAEGSYDYGAWEYNGEYYYTGGSTTNSPYGTQIWPNYRYGPSCPNYTIFYECGTNYGPFWALDGYYGVWYYSGNYYYAYDITSSPYGSQIYPEYQYGESCPEN